MSSVLEYHYHFLVFFLRTPALIRKFPNDQVVLSPEMCSPLSAARTFRALTFVSFVVQSLVLWAR